MFQFWGHGIAGRRGPIMAIFSHEKVIAFCCGGPPRLGAGPVCYSSPQNSAGRSFKHLPRTLKPALENRGKNIFALY